MMKFVYLCLGLLLAPHLPVNPAHSDESEAEPHKSAVIRRGDKIIIRLPQKRANAQPYLAKAADKIRIRILQKDTLDQGDFENLVIGKCEDAENLPLRKRPLNTLGEPKQRFMLEGRMFKLHYVSNENMNDFFNAIGLDRRTAIGNLRLLANEPQTRFMIANEIMAMISNNELPDEVKKVLEDSGLTFDRFTIWDDELSAFAHAQSCKRIAYDALLLDHLAKPGVRVSFSDVRNEQGSVLTAIDAIAYASEMGIKIFQPDEEDPAVLNLIHTFISEHAKDVAYLYYSDGQFYPLIPHDDGMVVSRKRKRRDYDTEEQRPNKQTRYNRFVAMAKEGSNRTRDMAEKLGVDRSTVSHYLSEAVINGDISKEDRKAIAKLGLFKLPEDKAVFKVAEAINDGTVGSYKEIAQHFNITLGAAYSYLCNARELGYIEREGRSKQFKTRLEIVVDMIKDKAKFNDILETTGLEDKEDLTRVIAIAYRENMLKAAECQYLKPNVARKEKNGVTRGQILRFLREYLRTYEIRPLSYTDLTSAFNQSRFKIHSAITSASFTQHEKKLIDDGDLTGVQQNRYLKTGRGR